MKTSINFMLNGSLVRSESGGVVLDWLRQKQGLSGTKEGCREGDCGACLVLLGGQSTDDKEKMEWLAVPSCLLALAELEGRHLISIEGLASEGPTPVMKALHGEGASQCGFCSPGIVIALTAFLLGPGPYDSASAMASVDGNLCRCTGYNAIRRAASQLASDFSTLPANLNKRIAQLAERGVLPKALAATMTELVGATSTATAVTGAERIPSSPVLGGGTDYFVRNPDPDADFSPQLSDKTSDLSGIEIEKGTLLRIGAAVSLRSFFASSLVREAAPGIERYEHLVASAPIRARATLAGNIANASPVADMTAMLIALGATLRLRAGAEQPSSTGQAVSATREVALEKFFLGYKKLNLQEGEYIEAILIDVRPGRFFSFEKASKRANLDIASVNSGFSCTIEREDPKMAKNGFKTADGVIILHDVRLSAGGVGPTPLFLSEASAFLEGKILNAELVKKAGELAVAGCSPQSDVRGSASYRSSMLKRFVYAHFLRLDGRAQLAEELFP